MKENIYNLAAHQSKYKLKKAQCTLKRNVLCGMYLSIMIIFFVNKIMSQITSARIQMRKIIICLQRGIHQKDIILLF